MESSRRNTRTASVAAFFTLVIVLTIAACAPVAPASPGDDQESTDDLASISLGVGFVPNVQFAPLYLGIEKGFFQDAGLNVGLEYGYEDDYLKLVGTGQTQFMIGSGDQVIIGRAQGLPVQYVMKWYTKYPVVIAALSGSGIQTPSDLEGKAIGIPGPFGASYVAFRGILEAAGLTERDVTMESIGFTQAAALAQGTVDAAVVYAANTPVVLDAEDIDTDLIALDDYLHIPANGLVTNDDTIRQHPELVSGMVAAMVRSIEYTLSNPDEAFEIALKYVPEAGGDNRAINRAIFDASLDFWRVEENTRAGESTLEEWKTAADFIRRINLIDALVEADTLFTNEFLP